MLFRTCQSEHPDDLLRLFNSLDSITWHAGRWLCSFLPSVGAIRVTAGQTVFQ